MWMVRMILIIVAEQVLGIFSHDFRCDIGYITESLPSFGQPVSVKI